MKVPASSTGQRGASRDVAQSKIFVLTSALIVLLSLGLFAYAAKSGTPLRYSDEQQYVELARGLREGRGFALGGHPTALRPPAWPLVIAFALFLGVPESGLAIVPALAMIGAAVIASLVGVKLAGRWGSFAGVAMLVYPLNIYTAILMYPQAFATFLVAALALLAVVVTERVAHDGGAPIALYVLAGVVSATLALSVPTLAFSGVLTLVWLVWTAHGRRRVTSLGLVAFAVPIAVWAVRNLVVLRAPVLLSTATGLNLLIGNNPTATGSSGVAVDIDAATGAAAGMNELDGDAYLRAEAIDWILGHPGDAITLYGTKVLNYFSPYNTPVTASAGTEVEQLIAYATFGLILLLVLIRLVLRRVQPLESVEKLFLSVWLANSLVMAVFFTRTRFRQPLDTLLLIEAGVAFALLVTVAIRRRSLN